MTSQHAAAPQPDLPLAVAVLIRHSDSFLVIRRAETVPLPGHWTPITGRLEPGETLAEACHREVAEEVGLRIELGEPFHEGMTSNGRFRLVYHAATFAGGTLALEPLEVAEARWLDPRAILALEPMLPTTRAVLARFFEAHGLSL